MPLTEAALASGLLRLLNYIVLIWNPPYILFFDTDRALV